MPPLTPIKRIHKTTYERLAALLRFRAQHESSVGYLALANLALAMADDFARDDAEFKREKFLTQCGFDYSQANAPF